MLNSYAHCQTTRANTKTKAWQRVCMPLRSTNTTNKQTDEKEQRSHNQVGVCQIYIRQCTTTVRKGLVSSSLKYRKKRIIEIIHRNFLV
jgi:hypothetical protein